MAAPRPTADSLPQPRPAIEDAVGVVLLVAILVVMGLGVFYRYVLNDSLTWPEEAARYGLAYITFIGLITGIRRGTHIRIDLLDRLLPGGARRLLERAIDLACLAFFIYMALRSYELCQVLHRTRSAAMGIPMSYAYGALVVGFTGAALRLAWRLIDDLRRQLRGRA